MKKITFWKSFFLLFALIVGSTNVWGQSDKSTVYTSNVTLSSGTNCTVVIGGTNYSGKKLGTNGNGGSCSFTAPSGTKYIHIHIAAWKDKSPTLTVKNGSTTVTSGISLTSDANISGSSTTWTLASQNKASTDYYKVVTLPTALTSSATITIQSVNERCAVWGVNTEEAVNVTSLSVKTASKVNYKVGEKLDLTGLVLDATVGGNHVDVTSDYTATIGGTAVISGTTALNTVGAQTITFTYGGQTTTQTIHVGALQSIALTTTSVKTEYNAGQTFDPTNLVVKASFSDEETTATEWEETLDEEDYTFSPDGALTTSDNKVTISYTWGEVEKTADIDITVNAATAYTVTFNAGTGSCATASLTEETGLAGVTLPTATISVTGWTFAGWAETATTNTEVAPTLYAATTTYHPVDNVTLFAVYKFVEGTEGVFIRETNLANVKAASQIIIVNGGKTLTTDLSDLNALTETENKVTAANKSVFILSGNDTDGYTLNSNSGTIGVATVPTENKGTCDLSITTSNNKWSIVSNTSVSNTFTFTNKAGTNVGLEYNTSSSTWMVYKPSSTPTGNQYYACKIYIPNFTVVYNSNPAAIINPSVAFTTAGNKTLYLKNTNTYNNAANVTGIAKTAVYTSSDATVASVSDAGVVTALKAGTTTITAKVEKEVGVNTEASASYEVTVKTASDVAGIKAITDLSTTSNFTADLTDAVVTYVKGNRAYIQDASGAIYVNFSDHGLTAGKKINGAVSGSVKAPNQIDEISALNLTNATVTNDGVIPDALVVTLATIVVNKAYYEGKRVQVTNATVTAKLELGQNSNGKISDDNKTTEMNLYAPDGDIEALKDAVGTFTGIISLYGGDTPRFNIYDQEWVSLTRNAPTAQTLTFAEDAIVLDEATDEYNAFTGQAVEGAQGTVTYSKTADESNIIESLNTETGAIVLSGACGTATIKASAAAIEVTEGGITTPYTATNKSYTITVYPRYTSTFSVNGVVTVVRQATHGAEIVIPEPSDVGDYYFMGWKETSAIDIPTDEAPTMVTPPTTPTSNVTYYAVYAYGTGSPVVEHTSTFTVKQASEPSTSPYVSDGSSWTWSNVEFANDASAKIKSSNGSITFTLPNNGKAKTLKITKTSNAWSSSCNVVLKDASNNSLKTFSLGSSASSTYTFTSTYDHSASYTLSNSTSYNAWTDNIEFKYETGGISYSGYRTSLPVVGVTIPASGYLSYCSPYKLDFSETNVKAYTASVDNTGTVTLTKVDVVPAEEGIVLFSSEAQTANEAKDYTIPVTAEDASDVTGNQMVGVLTRTQVEWNPSDGVYNYILQQGEFRKATTPGGYLKANRAYLSTSYDVTAAGARPLTIVFEGETTRISNVDVNDNFDDNAPMYNLAGQKVGKSYKGIVIQNGKKVVRK